MHHIVGKEQSSTPLSAFSPLSDIFLSFHFLIFTAIRLLFLIIIILIISTGNNTGITLYYIFYINQLFSSYSVERGIGSLPSSSVLGFASSSSSSSSSCPGLRSAFSHAFG
jgi:hypothetical protein